MDDDLKAVFEQFHVSSPRGSSYHLLREIDEKAEEYAEIHQRQAAISGLGTAGRDFSKAAVEIHAKADLTAAERESRLEEALRSRKEREDRQLATELAKERKAEESREAKRLHWEKLISKLRVPPAASDYYQSIPFKPGFLFLDALVRAPKVRLQELRLNIPHTLYFTTEIKHIFTDAMGLVVCDEQVSALQFLKLIERKRQQSTRPFDGVAVVLRGRGEKEHEVSKHLIDWVTFRHKIASHDLSQYTMLQQFIKSPAGKAAAIRLAYHPSSKDNKANSAYFLSSVVLTSSFSSPADLMQRCVIDLNYVDSFEIFKMTGTAIREVEAQAKTIVDYLNRGYGVRIDRIDLDFLKDETGKLWLCGCRGFVLDPTSVLVAQVVSKEVRQETMEERKKGSFVVCKLCRLHYPNYELSHLIAVRMLVVFKKHFSHRKDFPVDTSHIKVVTNDVLSQSVRVCDLCFMLITAEMQLIQTEKALALAGNIPYQEESIEEDVRHEMQLQFLPKSLVQWRALVYCRYMAFHSVLQTCERMKLVLELGGSRTSFEVNSGLFGSEQGYIPIERLRLFYIFSDSDRPPLDYFRQIKARMSLYDCANPSHLLAKGEFPIFSDFPRGVPQASALFQKKLVSLFPQPYSNSFPLTLTVGLTCDHVSSPKHLKTVLSKSYDAYLPEDFYCNGDPLPIAWMEIFQKTREEISFGEEPTLKDAYNSTLSAVELRRMEDVSAVSKTLSEAFGGQKSGKRLFRPISAVLPRNRTEATLGEASILDSKTQESVKDVFHTVRQYLHERPQSAVLPNSESSSSLLKIKSARSKRGTAATNSRLPSAKERTRPSGESANSTRLTSPLSRQLTFSDQFREISHRVSLDFRSLGLTSPSNGLQTEPF